VDWSTYIGGSAALKQKSTFGPDGPWQAVYANVGDQSNRFALPLWPSGSGITEILKQSDFGTYSPINSSTAHVTSDRLTNSDAWFSTWFRNESTAGAKILDVFDLPVKSISQTISTNATVMAADARTVHNPDGSAYTDTVGILGLGPPFARSPAPSILEQLKAAGLVASVSFGLHMGSAALNQGGSLVLGGYEQNRALGPVGVFDLEGGALSPGVFVVDVVLGTQTGASPLGDLTGTTSVYRGIGDSAAARRINREAGAADNTAVSILNPASPYIYLPLGTCEAAAGHLPVRWSDRLGLYLWDTADPSYGRIVRSPAYLGLVLSDRTNTNITIKVPFPLLNLTLTQPLADTPTPYFPCKPWNTTTGIWQLGRAFLQAAFMGVSYDHNVTFVAQAPGPGMDQSVVRALQPGDAAIRANDAGTFESTWAAYWTPVPDDGGSHGLPAGTVAGIAVAAAVLAVGMAAAAFLLRRRLRVQQASAAEPEAYEQQRWSGKPELDASVEVGVRHEIGAETASRDPRGHPELNSEHTVRTRSPQQQQQQVIYFEMPTVET